MYLLIKHLNHGFVLVLLFFIKIIIKLSKFIPIIYLFKNILIFLKKHYYFIYPSWVKVYNMYIFVVFLKGIPFTLIIPLISLVNPCISSIYVQLLTEISVVSLFSMWFFTENLALSLKKVSKTYFVDTGKIA